MVSDHSNMIDVIIDRLCADKDFVPASQADLPAAVATPNVDFLGVREYWGSIMTVGVLRSDDLNQRVASEILESFYAYTSSLRPLAGKLSGTKLGAFGLLLLVFERGCPDEFRVDSKWRKRGSAWRKDYSLAWLIDIEEKSVQPHRGLPLTIFPGRSYLRSLISGTGA